MPVAGEAPQRRKVVATLAALSGRTRPTIPASCSTFASKTESETDWRALDAMELQHSHRSGEDYSLSTEATAMQAIPSPRPIQPIPSLVVALTLTRAEVASAEDPLHLGPQRAEPRLLADQRRVDVDDPPRDRADRGAQQVDRVGVAPALVVVGKEGADVAAAGGAEQGVDHGVGEHVGVGVAGEAARVLDLDPAEDQAAPRGEAVAVVADPDAHRLILAHRVGQRLEPALAALEDADLPHPELVEELEGAVVAEADLLGQVGVGGEGEGGAGLDAHLGEAARRVDLADRLAQAGGRDLDRDPALGDRLDRRLVEVARVALGQRPGAAPDLDQVGVGEDVEEAGAGALGQRLEVAAPDLVGVALALPDVPAGVIDRGVADEVDRADDVVEVARLEQRRGAVLGAGDEVALDPEPQRRAADELAVGVEVVAGLLLPERDGARARAPG